MSKLISRELSWVDFNQRVLEEADNVDNPLFERGKFLSICESNLDEFFMVRVGGLVRSAQLNENKTDISGLTPSEQLSEITKRVRKQVKRQYKIYNAYMPQLENAGLFLLPINALNKEQRAWVSSYFDRELFPLLTPRAIEAKHPFPLLNARCLHLALLLPPKLGGQAMRFALLPLPISVPRVIMLPSGAGKARGVLLENIVEAFAFRLFGGVHPVSCQPFRITRNTDFIYNDSNADTLITEMRKNLSKRKWGQVLRLEIPEGFDNRILARLKRYLDVTENEIYAVNGPVNLNFFMKQLSVLEGFDEFRFPPFEPRIAPRLKESRNIFSAVRAGDLFFHHPYDSFDPIIRFLSEAADDPNVLAIKQTLYRVSGKSPIVAALSRAAKNGKQVTVLIEVRARFDEENNINWCLELEKAGCHVIYGVSNYKAHSKITLIIRREHDGLKRYVHLGTGNYNDVTAKIYTDMGLLTCDEALGRDAGAFFNMVTGYSETPAFEKLYASPLGIRNKLTELILHETRNAQQGLPAGITAKMNSLTDKKMAKLLYQAAEAGVPVKLIVRGACCVSPDKNGNLQIRSIVGRFLEHARAYVFENNGDKRIYLSSADMMTRNLDKRIELMFPIEDPDIKARVDQALMLEIRDNEKAWVMRKNGRYERAEHEIPSVNAQESNLSGIEPLSNLSL